MEYRKKNLTDKFWAKVSKSSNKECWLWTGSLDKNGYGQIWDGHARKMRRAHKLSAQIHHGQANDRIVMHLCDNPSCCNPNHLIYGTHAENCADKIRKDRHARGERQGHSKLTESQVATIRARMPEGYRAICDEYQLVPSTVYRIWHGQSWKHSIAR